MLISWLLVRVCRDDEEIIERVAYEFCEWQAMEGVCYTEARYSPHCFLSNGFECPSGAKTTACHAPGLTAEGALRAVMRGFERGEQDFGIKVRSILCCIQGHPQCSREILELALKYRDHVVAIDIAGNEDKDEGDGGEDPFGPVEIEVFQEAARQGLHRTVHSAEAGPARNVKLAIEQLKAERIGHGYRVVDDLEIYEACLKDRIHFECCPHSSILTGALPLSTNKHSIVKFAEDGANFSISRDDPTITQASLDQEYRFLMDLGMSEYDLVKSVSQKREFKPDRFLKSICSLLI